MLEVAEKDLKYVFINVLHMLKKLSSNIDNIKVTLKFLEMKTTASEMKNTVDANNSR